MKNRLKSLALALMTSALALNACVAPPTRVPIGNAPGQSAATAKPSILTIAVTQFASSFLDLDPSLGISGEPMIFMNTYETLLRYDPEGQPDKFVPVLATKWSKSTDGMAWTFSLRKGVTFHDGAPFNAQAVKYSVDRTKKMNSGNTYLSSTWDAVKAVKVVDDYTVTFELNKPAPMDLIVSCAFSSFMVSPKSADKDHDWFAAGHDAGTGPYMIEKLTTGHLFLTRFDGYWGGWKEGQFDTVIFEEVQDANVRQQKLEAGAIDIGTDIPYEKLAKLDAQPGTVVVAAPAYRNLLAILNTQKGPLKDVRVRRALAYSYPYDTFMKTALLGYGTPAKGSVPAGIVGHNADLAGYTYDLDKAKQLLEDAGYEKGGFDLKMTYGINFGIQQQMVELWRPELAKLGINLIPVPMSWEASWAQAKSEPEKAQDIFGTHWFVGYPTPYDWLYGLFHSEKETNFNFAYYKNPKYDEMVDKANDLFGTDTAAADKMFQDAQKWLIDDAVALFICDFQDVYVVQENLKGLHFNPTYENIVLVYQVTRMPSAAQ